MPAIQMKFVDAEDNRPIGGAHVLFHANAREGTLTGHGGERVSLFLVEAVTNDAGELRLPAQEFGAYPFLFNTNYQNPSMMVFKPGYAFLRLSNDQRIIAERQDVTSWQYNDQVIKMRRISSDKASPQIPFVWQSRADEIYGFGYKDICLWKKIPRFLVAVDHAVNESNRELQLINAKDRHLTAQVSPLRSLLEKEKYYTENGCGSPKMFFDPYLSSTNR